MKIWLGTSPSMKPCIVEYIFFKLETPFFPGFLCGQTQTGKPKKAPFPRPWKTAAKPEVFWVVGSSTRRKDTPPPHFLKAADWRSRRGGLIFRIGAFKTHFCRAEEEDGGGSMGAGLDNALWCTCMSYIVPYSIYTYICIFFPNIFWRFSKFI